MRIELATEPGDPDRPNEDFVSVALPASGQGGALVLLDGVTPPPYDTGCVHSVPWFTARLGGALGELGAARRDLTLRQILSDAISRSADAHRHTCDLSHARTPQATVVLARWDDTEVEHLVLSDSALLLESHDGRVSAVLDDRLDRLPRGALTDASVTDSRFRNREGGFWTAAADPSVAAYAVTGTSKRSEVRAVAALSDGATRWVDRFEAGDWRACLEVIRAEGARGLGGRVRALEHAEAATGEAPRRGKQHDDLAVAYVEW